LREAGFFASPIGACASAMLEPSAKAAAVINSVFFLIMFLLGALDPAFLQPPLD
jgi:hypothetical protein